MLSTVGRLMMTMGIALLVLALLVRLAPLTKANVVGDDLAIIASALVIVVGLFAARRGSRSERQMKE